MMRNISILILVKMQQQPVTVSSELQVKDSFSYELKCTLSSLIMLPSWQLLFPNKSLQAFSLP